MDPTSQNRRAINTTKTFFLISFGECLFAITILLIIPSDIKNSWILGYSRSRWIMLGGVFFLGMLFLAGTLYVSREGKKATRAALFLRARSSAKLSLVFEIAALLLIAGLTLLIAFHWALYQVEDISFLLVITRLNSVLILTETLVFQSLVFLPLFHSSIFYKPWFEGFIEIYSFPTLFISPLKRISPFFSRSFHWVDSILDRVESKVSRKLIIALFIVSPVLITSSLVWISFNSSIFDYRPVGSDEMVYWREILTFTTVGFDGGQYSTNEQTARVDSSHFDAHGPAFPVSYGVLGNLFGWQLYTGLIFNIILFTAALIVFIFLTNPNKKQLIILWLVLVTYFPVWYYLPTTRVESLLMVIAVLMAGLFFKIIIPASRNPFVFAFLFILILFAGLIRPSGSFLFIPFFWILIPGFSWKKAIKVLLVSIIPIAIVILFFQYFVSPYPLFSYNFIHSLGISGDNTLDLLFEHVLLNLKSFFSTQDAIIFVLLRFQLLWILIVSIIDLYHAARDTRESISFQTRIISFFNSSNLGIIALSTIILHTVHGGREYRLWAPHLLLSILILTFSSRHRLVLGVIVINLLFWITFGVTFKSTRAGNYSKVDPTTIAFQEATSDFLVFEPVENHWCNTSDISRYSTQKTWGPWILMFPEEFGVTWILNWEYFHREELKAKYVLLDPVYIEENYWLPIMEDLNLELLTETPIGNLYFNLDSECAR